MYTKEKFQHNLDVKLIFEKQWKLVKLFPKDTRRIFKSGLNSSLWLQLRILVAISI